MLALNVAQAALDNGGLYFREVGLADLSSSFPARVVLHTYAFLILKLIGYRRPGGMPKPTPHQDAYACRLSRVPAELLLAGTVLALRTDSPL
jgi:hypothetical protein